MQEVQGQEGSGGGDSGPMNLEERMGTLFKTNTNNSLDVCRNDPDYSV